MNPPGVADTDTSEGIAVMSRGAEDWGVREESTCVGRGKVRAGSSDVPGGPGRLSHEVGPLL